MKEILFVISLITKNKIKDYIFVLFLTLISFFIIILLISLKIFVGEKYKIFMDTGIFTINFIILIASILISSEIFTSLKKNKSLLWILSLPVKKKFLFIGCFFSFSILIFCLFTLYLGTFLFLMLLLKLKITNEIILYFIFDYIKFTLLGLIGLILSINYNFFQVVFFQIAIYFIGSSLFNYLHYYSFNKYLGKFLLILYFIFPDFSIPNLSAEVSHFYNSHFNILIEALVYYFSYILILLIIGALWLERKDIF